MEPMSPAKLMSTAGGEGARLRPVLGYGVMQRHVSLKLTRGYRVDIGGRSELIHRVPCGGRVGDVLN